MLLTLKTCIEPPSYARTAYVVAIWPSFLFDSFIKIWATCEIFLGKWFTTPPGKKFPVRLCLVQPTFCYMCAEIKYILFIQLTYSAFVLSFWTKILRKQNTASAETAWQFLAPKVLVLRQNKPASSRTPRHPIFNCNENPLAR